MIAVYPGKPILWCGELTNSTWLSDSIRENIAHVPYFRDYYRKAKLADVYLINGRPSGETRMLMHQVQRLAEAEDRELEFGISAFVICRDTLVHAGRNPSAV